MVTIMAKDMLHAQGYKLDDETRAELKAKADRHRARDGEDCLQRMIVEVIDFDRTPIGHLAFQL